MRVFSFLWNLSLLGFGFEISGRLEGWSCMVKHLHWGLDFWLNLGAAILSLQAIHRHGYTAGVDFRLLVLVSIHLAFILVLRGSGHGEGSSS